MKKDSCIICGAELGRCGEFCDTCLDFFTTKYKTGLKKELDRFRKTKKFLDAWRAHKDTTEKEVEE